MTTALKTRPGADLRLAWQLTRGSDRREWWRIGLTAVGAALATGIGLAVAALNSLDGYYTVSFGSGLLNSAGDRRNVGFALALLLIPVLGFLGQCARIGAVHRDRRLAALRLAGAGPWQVRRIAALESGPACLAGSLTATTLGVPLLLHVWARPTALAWAGIALVTVAAPVLGATVSALSLRRVVASPLGWVRRVRPVWGPGRALRVVIALLGVAALLLGLSPVTVVGAGFVGVREVLLDTLHTVRREGTLGTDTAYYTTGIDLTAAAILVALALTVTGLAVGTVESLATRRRSLAAQVAAGVPYRVLARALLLETALPLAPAVAVAGAGGTAIGPWYASLAADRSGTGLPYTALLVPVAVYTACLLAAATTLPLLRRSARPAELRHT